MAPELITTLGIASGLAAALCQSLSYVATRHFVQRRPSGASRSLLVLSHVWMGLFSLLLLPMVWPWGISVAWIHVALPLAMVCVFYLLGQLGLMVALRYTEPSRVSPLLGFKIVVLALMTTFLGAGRGLTPLQWTAVIVCLIATISLNFSGVALRGRAVLGVALACVAYSISDWNIGLLVAAIRRETGYGLAMASTLAAAVSYVPCGLVAVCFLPWQGSRRLREWRGSIPFALAWWVGMLFLYAGFGLIGVLFGNILQSTRGLMSVVLGVILVRWGLQHLEPASTRGVFFRRLASAGLMFLAVTLYMQGRRADDTMHVDTIRPTPAGATK